MITLLALTPSEVREWLPDTLADIPVAKSPIGVGVPLDVLRRRPDVRQAELAAIAASARAGVAKGNQYPSASLSGNLTLKVSDGAQTLFGGGAGDLFSGDSVAFGIGPQISIPLFNSGRLKNQWLAQDAVFQQSVEAYRLRILIALRDVENALVGLNSSKQRTARLTVSVTAYRRALEISRSQYAEGESDFQTVVDSQRQLVIQQQNEVIEQGNISLNQIALIRALGGSWVLSDDARLSQKTQQQLLDRTKSWGKHLPPSEENSGVPQP